jgi:hypothetical protein
MKHGRPEELTLLDLYRCYFLLEALGGFDSVIEKTRRGWVLQPPQKSDQIALEATWPDGKKPELERIDVPGTPYAMLLDAERWGLKPDAKVRS